MKKISDNHVLDKLPQRLVEKLMSFQKDGIRFAIEKKGRCLIADEMGLGKTIQAISVAYYFKDEWPLLIILPSSLRYCWIEELEKWLPDIHPHDINLIQAGNDAGEISTAKVTIITYGLLSKGTSSIVKEALLSEHFNVVICDESHYIRNSKTASSKAVVPLIKNANRRILLSGTPALSKPVELFTQLDSLCPGEFGSWWSFTSRYCAAKFEYFGKQKRRKVDGASNLEELQAKLSKLVMIRREKSQVLPQLPPKQRQKILFELKDSSMKKEILSTFDELRPYLSRSQILTSELFDQGMSEQMDSGKNPDVAVLGLISKLYKLSGEAKIGPAKDYIGMLCDNENLKFLIFAHHRVMLNGIQQTLWEKKVKFIRIDGDTLPSDRLMYVQQFQSDPDIRVAVLSILAAGVGLTFTAAKLVVFAEMHWTPGVLVQCEDRAHRIGQTGCVQIHYLVAKGTMDEWVWSAICRKTVVTSTALTGKGKNLEAEQGDKYQVDVLSNAEAWMPSKESQMDFVSFFQSQRLNDQPHIKDYFTPSPRGKHESKVKKSLCSLSFKKSGTQKRSRSKSGDATIMKKQKTNATGVCSVIILDDEEEFAFRDKNISKKLKNTKKMRRRKLSGSSDQDSSFEVEIPNFTLSTSNSSENTKNSSSNSLGSEMWDVSVGSKENQKAHVDKLTNSCADSQEKSFINESTDQLGMKKGTLCSHGKESVHFIRENQWACPVCTFLNHVDIPTCEMCDSPKIQTKTKVLIKTNTKKLGFSSDSVSGLLLKHANEINNVQFSQQQSRNNMKNTSTVESSNCAEMINMGVIFTEDGCDSKSGLSQTSNSHTIVCDSESLFSSSEETVVDGIDSTPFCHNEDSHSKTCLNKSSEDVNVSNIKCPSQDYTDYHLEKNDMPCLLSSKDRPVKNGLDLSCLNNLDDNTKERHSRRHGTKPQLYSEKHVLESENATQEIKCTHKAPKQLFKPVSLESVKASKTIHSTPQSDSLCRSSVSNENSDFQETASRITVRGTDLCEVTCDDIGHCSTPTSKRVGCHRATSTPKAQSVESIPEVLPVHSSFLYCCSRYTGRIYLFDLDSKALNENFLPLDIVMDNLSELPDLLHHPTHLRLVQKFTREWNCLSDTKKRLITKKGLIFSSPLLAYEDVRTVSKTNTQRHKTKEDIAKTAQQTANDVNGSVRLIRKSVQKTNSQSEEIIEDGELEKGCLQALSSDGVPLCLNCQQPYRNTLLQQSTIMNTANAWATRFCSKSCSDTHWMKTNAGYCRDKVYELEHGICQLCGVNAHSLYIQLRDTADLEQRAKLINKSKFSSMKPKVKEQMVKKPVAGQFWHMDHITPVWEGGGMCDIDNMRTLCTVCHQKVTSKQASKRATVRRLSNAVGCADITAFFQKS